jgi:hypothetical protein
MRNVIQVKESCNNGRIKGLSFISFQKELTFRKLIKMEGNSDDNSGQNKEPDEKLWFVNVSSVLQINRDY